MKKSHVLSIVLLFSIQTLVSAQSKSYVGIGTSFDFNKSIAATNNNTGLQPTDLSSTKYGIHAFVNSKPDQSFQYRVNTRISSKTIQFTSEDLAPFGDLMVNNVTHDFLAIDLGLTGLYALSLNENNKLLPAVGIAGSYNFDTRGFGVSRTDGELSAQDVLEGSPESTNRPKVMHLSFNTGLLYQTMVGGRLLEFYGMFYFSPTDSFEATYEYNNSDSMTYIGRNQSISLGINVPILLRRNLYKSEE